jgi:DNA-directed RNA polymerase specialized sigma24 family protein
MNRVDASEVFRLRHLEGAVRSYEEIANHMGSSVSQVKNALTLARETFRETMREVVAEVTETPEEVDTEIGYVLDLAEEGLP